MTLYQELRAAGKSAVNKVMAASRGFDFKPSRIARRMTLPTAGHTLIFDGEVAQNAFIDFWLHEYRIDGKPLVELVDPAAAGLTPLEAEVLQAQRQSYTSLFQTEEVLATEHQVRLHDLLQPDRPDVRLTDVGFSKSLLRFRVSLAMFCRLITVRGITMSSGFNFLFPVEKAPGLLQGCRQRLKRVPASELAEQRFVFFFQKYRQFGQEQRYEDVV